MTDEEYYRKVHTSKLISDKIRVNLVNVLLRQDMTEDIWKTIFSELSVKPNYDNEWITEELDLDDDEVTVTITTKKGKKIEFTKKLEILSPTNGELEEWDNTHEAKFVSRMRHPPANEVGGNTGVLR